MKRLFIFLLICTSVNCYSQDTLKMKTIDSLVTLIKNTTVPVETDTIINDRSDIGLKMTTYVSMVVSDKQLLKYTNEVHSTMMEGGVSKTMNSTSIFYFNGTKLIKVEESAVAKEQKFEMEWYYWEGRSIHYTLQTEKAPARAEQLITIAEGILSQVIK